MTNMFGGQEIVSASKCERENEHRNAGLCLLHCPWNKGLPPVLWANNNEITDN